MRTIKRRQKAIALVMKNTFETLESYMSCLQGPVTSLEFLSTFKYFPFQTHSSSASLITEYNSTSDAWRALSLTYTFLRRRKKTAFWKLQQQEGSGAKSMILIKVLEALMMVLFSFLLCRDICIALTHTITSLLGGTRTL